MGSKPPAKQKQIPYGPRPLVKPRLTYSISIDHEGPKKVSSNAVTPTPQLRLASLNLEVIDPMRPPYMTYSNKFAYKVPDASGW